LPSPPAPGPRRPPTADDGDDDAYRACSKTSRSFNASTSPQTSHSSAAARRRSAAERDRAPPPPPPPNPTCISNAPFTDGWPISRIEDTSSSHHGGRSDTIEAAAWGVVAGYPTGRPPWNPLCPPPCPCNNGVFYSLSFCCCNCYPFWLTG